MTKTEKRLKELVLAHGYDQLEEEFNTGKTPGSMDRASLTALIYQKFQGDEFLTEELNNELEKHLTGSPESSAEA